MLRIIVNSIKTFLARLFKCFPEGVSRRVRRSLSITVGAFFTGAGRLEGSLIGFDGILRMRYFGTLDLFRYLLLRTFETEKLEIAEGRILLCRVPRRMKAVEEDQDLMISQAVLEIGPDLERPYHFRGQDKVQQKIDISAPWEEIRKRFHSNARDTERKVRKYGFTCHISRDPKDFQYFYQQMYLPHTQRKFGIVAAVDPISWQSEKFGDGFLMVLDLKNQPVAATLCSIKDDTFSYWRMGVLDPDLDAARQGGQAALYLFMIQMAKEKGLKWVDLKQSRPFLNDGVFAHKRKWGSMVFPYADAESWVYYRILRYSEPVIRFFELNPAIVLTDQGLKGVVGWLGNEWVSTSDRDKLIEKYYSPGLQGLLLLTRHSQTPLEIPFQERPQDLSKGQARVTSPSLG